MSNDSTRKTKRTPATDGATPRTEGAKTNDSTAVSGEFVGKTPSNARMRAIDRASFEPISQQFIQFDSLYPVPFYDDLLVIASHNGQPYVVMRPAVDNMGLAWQSQHAKMVDKFKATVTMIVTVGEDGRQREMIALPLRKFPGWLYSLNPSKVAPNLRDKIVRYQDECDEVLWRYWTEGVAVKPGLDLIPAKDAMNGCDRIISFMARKEAPRAAKIAKLPLLEKYARFAGIPTPDVSELIGPDQPRLAGV